MLFLFFVAFLRLLAINYTEAFGDEEISAMEAEQAQENSIMQANIEEYESWNSSQTNSRENMQFEI